MKIRWTSRALRQLLEVIDLLEGDHPGSAAEFDHLIESTMKNLRSFPRAYPRVPGIEEGEVRRALLRAFDYWVIYEVLPGEVRVLSLWHARRRPPTP